MFQLPDSWVWDFWIVKNQDNYHLFFLYASRALHDPERRHHRAGIGHAVSTDLTRWERVTDALVHDDPPSFDHTATWTGSIVQGEDQRWYLFYTGATLTEHGQLRQQIGLATSGTGSKPKAACRKSPSRFDRADAWCARTATRSSRTTEPTSRRTRTTGGPGIGWAWRTTPPATASGLVRRCGARSSSRPPSDGLRQPEGAPRHPPPARPSRGGT